LLQVVTIPLHTRQRMHSHEKQTEVFYILEGEATITINGVDYLARPGDAFTRGCGTVRPAMCTTNVHNLWNKTKGDFELLVFKINLPEEGEDSHWHE
jgi:uncharacterized cupin superfamily protein